MNLEIVRPPVGVGWNGREDDRQCGCQDDTLAGIPPPRDPVPASAGSPPRRSYGPPKESTTIASPATRLFFALRCRARDSGQGGKFDRFYAAVVGDLGRVGQLQGGPRGLYGLLLRHEVDAFTVARCTFGEPVPPTEFEATSEQQKGAHATAG